jgi:hypothetical protein
VLLTHLSGCIFLPDRDGEVIGDVTGMKYPEKTSFYMKCTSM